MTPRGLLARVLRVAVAGGAVAGASWLGVGIVGAHGGDPAVVHGCVNDTGTINVVGPDDACDSSSQVTLDWAKGGIPGATGPRGPAGPLGPAGPAGPAGRPGSAGAGLSFETVTAKHALRPIYRSLPSDYRSKYPAGQSVSVTCPEGRYAVGGGSEVELAGDAVLLSNEADEALPNMRGWRVELSLAGDPAGPATTVSVHAVCAGVAPPPTVVSVVRPGNQPSGCAYVCAPEVLALDTVLRTGVPVIVTGRSAGSTITATVRCPFCRRPPPRPRAVAAASTRVVIGRKVVRRAKGGRVFRVRITRRGKRLLRRTRSARLVVRVAVKPRSGRTRRSSEQIRVQR